MPTIDDYKKAYDDAKAKGDKAGMESAHAGAEAIRASQGYSGGVDGSEYISLSPSKSTSQYDIQGEIQNLKNAQKQQGFAALDKSRDAALSTLQSERSQVKPRYYNARNDANVQNKLGAQNFAEYMANRGLKNSGENDQAQLMQNMSLQNQVGALKQQEAQAYTDLDRRTTDVQNAYQADRASVEAGAEAQAVQNVMEQFNRDREYGLSVAGLTGTFGGQRTLAGQQYDRGIYENDRAFDYQVGRDAVEDERYAQEFAEDVRRFGLNYALEQAQFKLSKQNSANDNARAWASLNAQNQERAYQRGQDALANADKSFNNAIGNIDSLYVYKDPYTGAPTINTNGLRGYILSLGLPDDQTTALLRRYGV